MDEVTLERLLARGARATVYPAAPALHQRVVAALLADGSRATAPRRTPRAAWAYALAVAAIVAIAATLAVPSSRSAVADFFGIEGSDVAILPTPAAGVTPTPFPTPLQLDHIATPTTLEVAGVALGYELAVPSIEEEPLETYLLDYFDLRVAILHYQRFDLWQTRLGDIGIFQKGVNQGSVIDEFTIKGQPARWISGGNHIVRFIGRDGQEVIGSQRTVDRNTLIWRTPYTFYGLETDLPQAEAFRIAETLP
jgi:hypothetical protein